MDKHTHDTQHDSTLLPVEGCEYCDKEIDRPIIRRHGQGKSTAVIPDTNENN